MYKIEKGIPFKEARGKIGGWNKGKSKYPFKDMEINDSFFVPSDNPVSAQVALLKAANYWAKGHHGKFKTAKLEGGVRCWRVE